MVKSSKLKVNQKAKTNVYLKDGEEYLGKDITSKPMGDNDRFMSFWESGGIVIIPMDLIKRAEIYFED